MRIYLLILVIFSSVCAISANIKRLYLLHPAQSEQKKEEIEVDRYKLVKTSSDRGHERRRRDLSNTIYNIENLDKLSKTGLIIQINQMTELEKMAFCKITLVQSHKPHVITALHEAGLNCFLHVLKLPEYQPSERQAHNQLSLKRNTTSPENWNVQEWITIMKVFRNAIQVSDLKHINLTVFDMLIQDGHIKYFVDAFDDPAMGRTLKKVLKSAYGDDPSQWNSTVLKKIAPFFPKLDKETINSISPKQLHDAASSFKDLKFEQIDKMVTLGEKLIQSVGEKPFLWNASDIINLDQYIRTNPRIVNALDERAILQSLTELGARKTSKRQAAVLAERLKSMTEFKDPCDLDHIKIAKLGQLMLGMGRKYLKGICVGINSKSLPTFSSIKFPPGDAKRVMDKIKGDVRNYTAAHVKEFGHLITGLGPSDLTKIPASAIAASIKEIADNDFDRAQCRLIVKKVNSAGKENIKHIGDMMHNCISPSDLSQTTLEDLGISCLNGSKQATFTSDKATAMSIMSKTRARFPNHWYKGECLLNVGKLAAIGMELANLQVLKSIAGFDSAVEIFSKYEDVFKVQETATISGVISKYFDKTRSGDDEDMKNDHITIKQMGVFMKHLSDEELQKFDPHKRALIVKELAKANMHNLPLNDVVRLKKFALKNIDRENTPDSVTDRTNAETLDDIDISTLGNLVRGLEDEDFKKMSVDAFTKNAHKFKLRSPVKQQQALREVITKEPCYFNLSGNVLAVIGMAGGMDENITNSIDSDILGENLAQVASVMEAQDDYDKTMDETGFHVEVSKEERVTSYKNKQNVIQKAIMNYKSYPRKITDPSRRKLSLTCGDLIVLGKTVKYLTPDQIEAISTMEFEDCVETLGLVTTWSKDQLKSLMLRAKATFGSDVSKWQKEDVKLMGTMIGGLTHSEISTLPFYSADIMSIIGTSDMLSPEQLQAGFYRFLQLAKKGKIRDVTGDDLIIIGSFVCGMKPKDIIMLHGPIYKKASTFISKQSKCDIHQLEYFAKLAERSEVYDIAETWGPVTIQSVGIVIAGLPSIKIKDLGEKQLQHISPLTIANMPPNVIKHFTKEQLQTFSPAQANAVTKNQQETLSEVQLKGVSSAGGFLFHNTDTGAGINSDASAGQPMFSWLLPVTCMFCLLTTAQIYTH